jgi:hypothetical protein
MPERVFPRYPVYIPTKGRFESALTAKALDRDGVPFLLVVEPQERIEYESRFGSERVVLLPEDSQGLIYARNWIKGHATEHGHKRHWQLDDNIRKFRRMFARKRLSCRAGVALRACEDFTDRYENVAVSGLNYDMFGFSGSEIPPFYLNNHVYSCSLVLNSLPYVWRSRYNDDTDMCLQVIAGGWCTILVNAFQCDKARTMTLKGGNTEDLYQGDGRAKMSRELERRWPYIVTTKRRFQRPQHVVRDQWRKFDTPLIRCTDGSYEAFQPGEYGMTLEQQKPIKSERIRKITREYNERANQ